jgi:hypothetical protein
MRIGVYRAQGPEHAAVGAEDRHGDIALQPIDARRGVVGVDGILGGVVEGDDFARRPHLVAQGGLDRQFAADAQAEVDLVADCAGDPVVLRNAGDGGEPHARDAAADFEDRRHRVETGDRRDRPGPGIALFGRLRRFR